MLTADLSKVHSHDFGGKHWEGLHLANETFSCIIYEVDAMANPKVMVPKTSLLSTSEKYCPGYHSNHL